MLFKWMRRLFTNPLLKDRETLLIESFHSKDSNLLTKVLAGLELITRGNNEKCKIDLTLRGKFTTSYGSFKKVKSGIEFILSDHRLSYDFGMDLNEMPREFRKMYDVEVYRDSYYATNNSENIVTKFKELYDLIVENEELFSKENPERDVINNRTASFFRELIDIMEIHIHTL